MKTKLLFISLLLCFFGFAQDKFHDTKGSIDVTNDGQLQFRLSIAIPVAAKNVAPKLDLIYTSSSGNGIAGYGWNISGISSISRISRNINKDGETKVIELNYSDYYSFNGQRLILTSGLYGKDGAEYTTDKYSNIKIKSIGTKSGVPGPLYFHVTFEDGSQALYGSSQNNDASRTAIEYNITKWVDSQGNYITYEYERNAPISNETAIYGEVTKIKKVKWGGNEILNKPHFNEILFNYNVDRILKENSYHQGYYFNQDKLMNEIIVSSNQQQFKRYFIEYSQNTTSYQFVNKITEFNANNEPANPVAFQYQENQTGSEETSKENDIATTNTKKYADFDMDGITDYLEFIPNPGSSPNGPVGVLNYKNSVYKNSPVIPLQYDLSKFSLNDFKNAVPINLKKNNYVNTSVGIVIPVIKPVSSQQYISGNNNIELQVYSLDIPNNKLNFEYSKTLQYDQYNLGYEVDNTPPLTYSCSYTNINLELSSYDFDGDNISELILNLRRTLNCTDMSIFLPTDPGTGLEGGGSNPTNPQGPLNPNNGMTATNFYSSLLIDLDENDIMAESVYAISEHIWTHPSPSPIVKPFFADLNGDGIQDILEISNSGTITKVFNIKKYSSVFSTVNVGGFAYQSISNLYKSALFGDFNGDSKVDILVPKANKSYDWDLYVSNGVSLNKQTISNFIFYSAGTEMLMESNHNVFEAGGGCSYNNQRYFQYNTADLDADGKSEIIVTYVYFEDHEWSHHHDLEKTILRTAIYSVNKTTNDSSANLAWKFLLTGGGDYNFSLQSSPIQSDGNINFYRVRDWKKDYNSKVIPFGTLTLNRNNQQIITLGRPDDCSGVIGCPYNYIQHYNYIYMPTISKIKSIDQGGITTIINYKEIDNITGSNFYKPTKKEQFPFFELEKVPYSSVVSKLQQNDRKQDFQYRGLMSHLTGKGMIGFRQVARSSWYADGFENTKVWSGLEIDPLNEGFPIKEWSIKTNDDSKVFPINLSITNNELLSFKSTSYKIDKLLNGQIVTSFSDDQKPKIVLAIVPELTIEKDFLKSIITNTTVTYGDYYLPQQSVSNVNNGYALKTDSFEYYNNPTGVGANYYIGRPKNKNNTVQAYGDTKSAKEEYTYDNNLIKTLKKWNRDNTGFILDTYNYDNQYGNIVQQITSNSIASQIQTLQSQYDPKGRFVITKTDNLGLETTLTYNDLGEILVQTDPLGNTITNTYDGWGKILNMTSSLSGTKSYYYEKLLSGGGIKTQETNSVGNIIIKYTNPLGQNYKSITKSFNQGQYISVNFTYDPLGRKTAESEPYYEGQNPTQWNTIFYDDNYFPTKVIATSFTGKQIETSVSGLTTTVKEVNGYGRITSKTTDAIGNLISSVDKGGTIQFDYNAAGEQTNAIYGTNIVSTAYDSWGRKSEFEDPSNGNYTYEYNGFGQALKVTSPKGEKQFVYNNIGQLNSQTESSYDGYTDKTITFTYDNFGRLTSKSGLSNGKPYSSVTEFDPQGRFKGSVEMSNDNIYTVNTLIYDNKSRLKSYSKILQTTAGGHSQVSIENSYNDWNGELNVIKDKVSNKVLWSLQQTNERGQVLSAVLGRTRINNLYGANGMLSSIDHEYWFQLQGTPSLLQVNYNFDAINNELTSRTTGGNFNVNEIFNYDDNNRLISWTNPRTGLISNNTYDIKGRIIENDQLGEIKYENDQKIYQATSVDLNDAGRENYTNDLIQHINYNENNDPIFIDGIKGDVKFEYGLSSMRQKVSYGGNFDPEGDGGFIKLYNEDGSFEITIDKESGKEKHIIYIGGSPYESDIMFVKNYGDASGSYKFLHKDYLGSILAVSDSEGNRIEQRHYDAWGNLTHLQIGNGPIYTDKNEITEVIAENQGLITDRGYTSHEHFQEVGIIHMNGRLYDPLLRRFLNADENIQDSFNTQNYNKYGYVLNNPLLLNDPSGEDFFGPAIVTAIVIAAIVASYSYTVGVSISGQNWDLGQFAKTVTISSFTAAVTYGIGPVFSGGGFFAAVGNGAVSGAISGGINSIVNGTDIMKGILTGAVLGGAIGGISYTINYYTRGFNKVNYKTTSLKADGKQPVYDPNISYEEMQKSVTEMRGNFEAPFGVNSDSVGFLYGSDGYLYPGGGIKSYAYTTPKNFWTGNSDIFYAPITAQNKELLAATMVHETGHAYLQKLGILDVELNYTIKVSSNLDVASHLAMAKLERLYGAKNFLLNSVMDNNGFYNTQYQIDRAYKNLNVILQNHVDNIYKKLVPVFDRFMAY